MTVFAGSSCFSPGSNPHGQTKLFMLSEAVKLCPAAEKWLYTNENIKALIGGDIAAGSNADRVLLPDNVGLKLILVALKCFSLVIGVKCFYSRCQRPHVSALGSTYLWCMEDLCSFCPFSDLLSLSCHVSILFYCFHCG